MSMRNPDVEVVESRGLNLRPDIQVWFTVSDEIDWESGSITAFITLVDPSDDDATRYIDLKPSIPKEVIPATSFRDTIFAQGARRLGNAYNAFVADTAELVLADIASLRLRREENMVWFTVSLEDWDGQCAGSFPADQLIGFLESG